MDCMECERRPMMEGNMMPDTCAECFCVMMRALLDANGDATPEGHDPDGWAEQVDLYNEIVAGKYGDLYPDGWIPVRWRFRDDEPADAMRDGWVRIHDARYAGWLKVAVDAETYKEATDPDGGDADDTVTVPGIGARYMLEGFMTEHALDVADDVAATLNTPADVRRWIDWLVVCCGVSYHPDTDDYTNMDDEAQAKLRDANTKAWAVCEQARVDLYEIGLGVFARWMAASARKEVVNA